MMRRLWWIAPGALVLAWLVMLAPSSAAMAGLLFDAQLLLAWPDTPRGDVAVVEIDDASVRALQTQLGPWPYAPATHAALAEFLLELGAKAVVLDVPLTDAPDGDGALARSLRDTRVVLGVRTSRAAADATDGATHDALPPLGRTLPAHWPRTEWPALSAPVATLVALQPPALGVVATPDGDAHVARWPLMHEVQGRGLPALPLAALQAVEPAAPLRYASGAYQLGAHHWPLDAQGRVVLPHVAAQAVPTIGFLRVGAAAWGITDDPSLRQAFSGRVVFVGRNVGAAAPRAAATRTQRLAAATSALAADQALHAPSRALDALLISIALLPAVALWRRGTADRALDPLLSTGAAGALLMTSTLALAAWRLPSHALPALAVSVAVGLLAWCAARFAERTRGPHAAALGATSTRRISRATH